MAMSAELQVNICSSSPVMATSPYEWEILEWDDKQTNKLTNKQTNKQTTTHTHT